MFLRLNRPYKRPAVSHPVEILGHSGELVLTVNLTDRLNKELNAGPTLSEKLRKDIMKLLSTIQVEV
jgi:hypothetical protein